MAQNINSKSIAQPPVKGKKWGLVLWLIFVLIVIKIGLTLVFIFSSDMDETGLKTPPVAPKSNPVEYAAGVEPQNDKQAPSYASPEKQAAAGDKNESLQDTVALSRLIAPGVANASPPPAIPVLTASQMSQGASALFSTAQAAAAELTTASQTTDNSTVSNTSNAPALPPSSGIPLPPGSEDLLKPTIIPQAASENSGVTETTGTAASTGAAPKGTTVTGIPTEVETYEQLLKQKESQLAVREEALKTLETELNDKLAAAEAAREEMKALTARNEAVLAELKTAREEQQKEEAIAKDARIEHLVTAYKSMKPEQAGGLVNSLDDDVAVAILSAMPGRNAGQILAYVNPDKAARLTKSISERRIDPSILLESEQTAQ